MSLANRYRPQLFSDVVGQKLATTALSRAAAQDRVAPAYLLSGTRGVGKTTIARIFAKALNCERAPTGEPCNACGPCQRVTGGNHVDVMEIDGASNTSVDDVRALRENIGFAPMEGRYKIFIVDEAHMLSRSAFNALLKTLEEPPPRAVFIFATTEAHKFPPTIISRCQHFVFRHLPENLIFDHLRGILEKEKVGYEDDALHLVARRAQGSARDSLSLLDQILALGAPVLDSAIAREALGLAGQEFFGELFVALKDGSFARILELARHLLQNGVDISFFVREFAASLRNLFLFSQAGEAILPTLELSQDECDFIKKYASFFPVSHLHAAWQMTLDAQRAISMSPEPGAALELMLMNLAMLPKLLPVADVRPQIMADMASSTAGAAPKEESAPRSHEAETEQKKAGMPQKIVRPLTKVATRPDAKVDTPASDEGWDTKWDEFRDFCMRQDNRSFAPHSDVLSGLRAVWQRDKLVLQPQSTILFDRLQKAKCALEEALRKFCNGDLPKIEMVMPDAPQSNMDMMDICRELPEVRLCRDILGATLVKCKKNSHKG